MQRTAIWAHILAAMIHNLSASKAQRVTLPILLRGQRACAGMNQSRSVNAFTMEPRRSVDSTEATAKTLGVDINPDLTVDEQVEIVKR